MNGVELNDGDILQADLVVVAVGVVPNTDLVTGVDKLKDRSLKVDPFMQYANERFQFVIIFSSRGI